MLINFPKKDNVTSKVIKKKTLTKINTNVKKIKKTKKMRRFRFRFKPIHYFLKSFIKKIKKYNIRRYKSLVKYYKDTWFGPPFPTVNYIAYRKMFHVAVYNTMTNLVKTTWKRLFTSSSIQKPADAETM